MMESPLTTRSGIATAPVLALGLLCLVWLPACASPRDAAAPASPASPASASSGAVQASRELLRDSIAIAYTVADRDGRGVAPVEGRAAVLRLEFRDPATGQPLVDARPAVWLDRRVTEEPTSAEACRQKVQMYLQGRLYPEGSIKAHADLDLNSFYLLTLNVGATIAVIDPIMGFGKTKLYTTVPLDAQGADWALTEDATTLFVSMPSVGRVAVVDTDTWDVTGRVETGGAPGAITLGPQEQYLWVGLEGGAPRAEDGGIAVIDVAAGSVVARFTTGVGPHAFAFTPDGARAFIADRSAATVTVVDVASLSSLAEIPVGRDPVDIAYSVADGAVYVASEADGSLVAIDARTLATVRRLDLGAGLRTIRFAPADAHGGHGGHAAPVSAPPEPGAAHHSHGEHAHQGALTRHGPERWGFALNPRTHRVHVLDAVTGELVRSDSIGTGPADVAFTGTFAYVRSAGSPEVALIPLADPTLGGVGHLEKFDAGESAPAAAGPLGRGDAIVPSPDMHDAIFALNPRDRMIYYYHYMEGMPIPSGGLTTYGFQPRAIKVVPKGLRRREPGVFSATVRLTERGEYDLVMVVDSPRVVECLDGLRVLANPDLHDGRIVLQARRLDGETMLQAGPNAIRFELKDALTGTPLADLEDASIIVSSSVGAQVRARGSASDAGIYEFTFEVPPAPVYYVSFEIPSLDLFARSRPPLVFRGEVGAGG